MKIIIVALSVSLLISLIVIFNGCKTFNRVEVAGQPIECNDMYTFMDFSLQFKGLFSGKNNQVGSIMTLVSAWSVKCETARTKQKKELKIDRCIKLIYGAELLPKKSNYKQYADYMDCIQI